MIVSEDVLETAITKEQIAEFQKKRIEECGQALGNVLSEYDCDLIAVPQIVDGRIVAVVQVISK